MTVPPPENPRLTVLFEDTHLVAVAKPAGCHASPQRPDETGTVTQRLVAQYPQLAGVGFSPREPGVCHRLDYWTSGVLVAAKDQTSFAAVRQAFDQHAVKKTYLALVTGAPPDSLAADAEISHRSRRSKKVLVGDRRGRGAMPARTEFFVMQRGATVALVRAVCTTGAMHQVRAHAAHAGFPLLGDVLYGGPAEPDGRFWLHAASVEWPHPQTGARLTIEAPLPDDFRARLAQLV
jgi:23S rRNA pseudouridine1911/1915/1917 synthase